MNLSPLRLDGVCWMAGGQFDEICAGKGQEEEHAGRMVKSSSRSTSIESI